MVELGVHVTHVDLPLWSIRIQAFDHGIAHWFGDYVIWQPCPGVTASYRSRFGNSGGPPTGPPGHGLHQQEM